MKLAGYGTAGQESACRKFHHIGNDKRARVYELVMKSFPNGR